MTEPTNLQLDLKGDIHLFGYTYAVFIKKKGKTAQNDYYNYSPINKTIKKKNKIKRLLIINYSSNSRT